MGSATRATWVTVATKKGLFGELPRANALRAQASDFVLANKKEETEVSPRLMTVLVDRHLAMVMIHIVS